MVFGLDKCAVLEMRWGRQVSSSGINLPDDQHSGQIEEEGYKCLGILQFGPDSQHQDERQDNIGVYQKSQGVV